MHLESALCPLFHNYSPTMNDVEVLTLAVLVMVLMHAVMREVLSSTSGSKSDWISAISHIVVVHDDLVQHKVRTISVQVEAIVREMKDRNIITKLKLASKWKFSQEEAHMFARRLNKCVKDNLM